MDTIISTSPPLRLLLVKTSSMGDLVHTLSAIQEACDHQPGVRIDWVCEEAFVDVPALSPAVSRVIPLAIRRWRRSWLSAHTRGEIKAFIGELRREAYDIVIDAQGLIKTAWITALARCPSQSRWGYDRASIREPLAALVLNHRVHAPREMHAIARLQQLFAQALGYAPADVPPVMSGATPSPMRSAQLRSALGDQRFVMLLHSTSRAAKSWPSSSWAGLAQTLSAQGLGVVLPWGSPTEHDAAQAIARAVGPQAWVTPRLSIREIAEMMAGAEGVIGVDTGLMHLSAAMGRPTVAVMPAGRQARFSATRFAPPWTSHVRVVLPPSDQDDITVDAVMTSWASLS